jgi:hypothetical protein
LNVLCVIEVALDRQTIGFRPPTMMSGIGTWPSLKRVFEFLVAKTVRDVDRNARCACPATETERDGWVSQSRVDSLDQGALALKRREERRVREIETLAEHAAVALRPFCVDDVHCRVEVANDSTGTIDAHSESERS